MKHHAMPDNPSLQASGCNAGFHAGGSWSTQNTSTTPHMPRHPTIPTQQHEQQHQQQQYQRASNNNASVAGAERGSAPLTVKSPVAYSHISVAHSTLQDDLARPDDPLQIVLARLQQRPPVVASVAGCIAGGEVHITGGCEASRSHDGKSNRGAPAQASFAHASLPITTPPTLITRPFSTYFRTAFGMVPAPPLDVAENGLYGGLGPHPSHVQVAKPYIFEQEVLKCLEDHAGNEAREAATRLQGVLWIDNVRKALHLPVKTYNTAVVYYHKFRLAHAESDYMNVDAAAAALFTACKIEDTLKKSRDVLCAAYNLKVSLAEQLTPDDSIFEESSKRLVGLERLMLESSGFDFRNRNPQEWVVKFTRLGQLDRDTVGKVAYRTCLDLYRTYAPVKQSSSTLGLACVELAARLQEQSTSRLETVIGDNSTMRDKWGTSRAEVMETLLDLLELYTHHRTSTIIGPEYPIDSFIAIRITLNKEATAADLPRHTEWVEGAIDAVPKTNGSATNGTKPSPMSPANPLTAPSTVQQSPAQPGSSTTASPGMGPASRGRMAERKEGTIRYMLDAERAKDETDTVASYFKEEWEEYEEIIERPARPAQNSSINSVAAALDRDREADRDSSRDTPRARGDARARDKPKEKPRERSPAGSHRDRNRSRERQRDRERERDREKDVRRRDREDDRDRHRHREVERDRERERDRDRVHHRDDRERERDRDGHRHRERDDRDGRRDRDRERDRERDGHRYRR